MAKYRVRFTLETEVDAKDEKEAKLRACFCFYEELDAVSSEELFSKNLIVEKIEGGDSS